MEAQITDAMREWNIPGISISIISEDNMIYAKSFGARNLEQNLPVTIDTLFGIGSCTKSFTALAIILLVQEGKLNLNDPVHKYLPFKLGSKKQPITIHHLLTHSSGLPNLNTFQLLYARFETDHDYMIPISSWDDLYTFLNQASDEIAGEPGEKYFYCNVGYTLLGAIVEKVSNIRFEQFVREKILIPLKMDRSTFLKEEFYNDPNTMTPYISKIKDGKTFVESKHHLFNKFIYSPGGLLSSSKELINYLRFYLNNGEFEEKKLIKQDILKKMLESHIETHGMLQFGKSGYGYGWGISEDFFGHKLISHSGSTAISGAILMFIPEKKLGLAGVLNSGGTEVLRMIGFIILATLLGKNYQNEFPYFRISQKIRLLEGTYESYKGIDRVSIKKEGSMLYLKPLNEMEIMDTTVQPLIPETDSYESNEFYILTELGRQPIEFVIKDSNNIDLIIERNIWHKKR